MSTKGTQFSRTMRYFQEVDIHEAWAAWHAAEGILTERDKEFKVGGRTKQRRTRKGKNANGESTTAETASTFNTAS